MRYYSNIEEAHKAARNRAEEYRTATNLIPIVIKILKDFDNKVYNCRLEKALKEATNNRVYCDRSQYSLQIYTYPEGNYSHHITLASVKAEDLPEGKRIPADKLIESTRSYREKYLSLAYDIESKIDQMAQVTAYIEQTKNKLEAFCRSFNTDLRDIYNIPYCIRTN